MRRSSSSCHIAAAGKRPPQVILPSCFRGGGGVWGDRERVYQLVLLQVVVEAEAEEAVLPVAEAKAFLFSPPLIFFSPRLLACFCLLCSAGFCLYERELKLPRPPQPQRWKISQGTRDAHTSPFPRKKKRERCPKSAHQKQVLGFPPPPKKV